MPPGAPAGVDRLGGGRPSAAPSQGAGPMGGTARIGSRDGRLLGLLAFGGAQLLCVPAAAAT